MKIYTKTGDDGSTGLYSDQRISKSNPRIDCIGTMDELNAVLGWAAVPAKDNLLSSLRRIQNELFTLGAYLAAPGRPQIHHLPMLNETTVDTLEKEIDAAEEQLPDLRDFILPGGTELAARLHTARAVCRRAERLVVALAAMESIVPLTVIYLNRLSDWLFVQARRANQQAGLADVPWNK